MISHHLRRWVFLIVRFAVGTFGLLAVALFFLQGCLVWHPRAYAAGRVESFPRPLAALDFHTSQGKQTVFYAPPRDRRTTQPTALWVLFAGNGSLALDWGEVVAADDDPGRAFLFVEYPGYGRCEGKPSPATIRENADGALDALAHRLGQPDGPALERTLAASGSLRVAGHSMGTGAALEFAAAHPGVSQLVLVSPFTSLRDMAQRTVGWPLNWILRGNFDNRGRMNELAARATPPSVLILHGDHDTFIPQTMGRALAAAHPAFTRFEPVVGAGHDDVLDRACPRLLQAMDGR